VAAAVQAPFDRAALETRFRGNSAFVDRLLATTAASQAGTPARLRQLAESDSRAELAHIAHGLKGLCGNLTAHKARQAAAMLDDAARRRDSASAELARQLADEIDRLLEAIGACDQRQPGTQSPLQAADQD
jgi:HPt (histidine-containing phosphotransfer) domain-containing protein